MNEDGDRNARVGEILEFRARDFPGMEIDMTDLGKTLVGIF